jgi:hypothetical protein
MIDDDFEYDFESVLPDVEDLSEIPRDGSWWVRKHNHEVLAPGDIDCPEPENSGVVLRRYFTDLGEAIAAWGGWPSSSNHENIRVARECIVALTEELRTEPLEYFFVEPSCQYIAVVTRNSNHAGRLWLNKREIHSLVRIPGSVPFEVKGKTFFKVILNSSTELLAVEKKVCSETFQIVPTSGVCPCESPRCEFSGIS